MQLKHVLLHPNKRPICIQPRTCGGHFTLEIGYRCKITCTDAELPRQARSCNAILACMRRVPHTCTLQSSQQLSPGQLCKDINCSSRWAHTEEGPQLWHGCHHPARAQTLLLRRLVTTQACHYVLSTTGMLQSGRGYSGTPASTTKGATCMTALHL